MDLKQKKKRIAHNSSSIGGEVEDTKMADDYVADIMNAMNLTHKSTSIISYQQLEDIRKQKRGDSSNASFNIATESTDQNMTVPKRLDLKKNHPLMAKCQRNLKILKHNRTVPKPRAHVGAISNVPRPMEKFNSSKKCVQKSDKPKSKVEPKKTTSMAESNKTKTKVEPIKTRIPKTSESLSHQSKPSNRKRYKRCRLQESDVSDHNITDKAIDDRSSESDSGFEKFIKTHHIVNKHKIPTSSDSDSSSDEADYLKPRNPKKKRHSKMRKVSLSTNRSLGKDSSTLPTYPSSQGKCVERTDDGSSASDLEPVDDTHFSSDDSSELKLPTPAKMSSRVLSKEKSITCVEDPRNEILKPVSTKSQSTSEKNKSSSIGPKLKTSKSGSKKRRSDGTTSKTTMKSLPTVSVSKENIVSPDTDSKCTQPFSTHSDVSQKINSDWVVMGSQKTNSGNQDSLKDVNTASTSDLGIQIEAVFSLGTSDQTKSHCNIFEPPDSDIEVICDDIQCSNKIEAESVDVVSSTISSIASTSKMFFDNHACVSKSPKISRKARKKCFSVISNEMYPLLKEIKKEKDDSMIRNDDHLNTKSACEGNTYSVSEDGITDSTSNGECSTMTTVKVKDEIFHDDDIQILPYRIVPYTDDHSVIGGDQHSSKENSTILNYSNKLNEGTQLNEHSNVFETLKKIDLGLIKEFVQKSSAPLLSVKTEPNDSDVEVVCIESDEETLPVSEKKSVGDVTAKVKAKQLATNQKQQQLSEKTDVIAVRDSALLKSSKKARLSQSYDIRKNKFHKPVKCEGGVSDVSDELDSIAASASDELDNIAVSAIKDLGVTKTKNSALLLLELYKKEYERYIEVRSTEQNVSAGLKLLEEKQLEKLKHLVTAIKNVAKNDPYFNKLYKERHPKKIDSKSQRSDSSSPAAVCKSEEKGETETSKVSAKKTNFMCVECNKPARAACQGCFKVYYCSRECGEAFWSKGHITACGK